MVELLSDDCAAEAARTQRARMAVPSLNPSDDAVQRAILDLATARGPGKTICPSEAARALAGQDPERWSKVMPAVRRAAILLMREGRVEIRRKGRPVDPDDFRGVYRIAILPSPE